jgi:hypothetical protein
VISEWVAHRAIELTELGTRGRQLKQPKLKPFVEYSLSLAPYEALRPSSQAILTEGAVTFSDPETLSSCLKGFVR